MIHPAATVGHAPSQKLSHGKEAELAATIADAGMTRLEWHAGAVMRTKEALAGDQIGRVRVDLSLIVGGSLQSQWGIGFLSALQSTSGATTKPTRAAEDAEDIANQAAHIELNDEHVWQVSRALTTRRRPTLNDAWRAFTRWRMSRLIALHSIAG
jgi:hypothetical protein